MCTGLKLVNSDVKFEKDLKGKSFIKNADEENILEIELEKGAKEFAWKQMDTY
ncbi:MAG: hypothetical protein CM15mV8_1460 [Caudoviricetes sp.]|nr:MAG: hypothetical protein CM15mV8_1460 [Caudoviricetes sp.]